MPFAVMLRRFRDKGCNEIECEKTMNERQQMHSK
jgi:hypothetical protein